MAEDDSYFLEASKKEPPYGDMSYYLWLLIHRAWDVVSRARSRELRSYGMTYIQAGTISVIRMMGNPTEAQVARWMYRRPQSISELLSRMEKAGLVTRMADTKRKNLVRVALTDKGERAYKKTLKRNSLNRVFSQLSEEEQRYLRLALEMMVARSQKALRLRSKAFFVFPEEPPSVSNRSNR